ncbi:MAG: carboxypeptidase-like regulatory domain-containing protein [Cyclobacteriaceae bacterium]|nr:carboxypeptidase-like regulatory domain-containing protein [Cyclobacteriaceae bacterium]
MGRTDRLKAMLIMLAVLLGGSFYASAQETIISGKVTDAGSGDPIPFANIVFKGTTIGTTTDFDGNFLIKTANPTDTLLASYIGYKVRGKFVRKGVKQVINFQLVEEVTNLQEVIVKAGENPAFEILRKVVRNKNNNDKRKLTAYEYDTYTKIEIDVDNISDKFRERKMVKRITQVLDSVERIAGEDGKPILPLFITESVSKVYYRDNPSLKKEHILKTKISGVGVEDGSTVTQMVGSSFQEYNFYQNWLNILSKEFVSPIADGWRIYYDYDLTDSLYVGEDYCYRLDFFPRSPQDLAFTGTMWITKKDYALKQMDASMGKQANLNFIEKIRIQQELTKTDLGAWVPIKNRVLIDVGQLGKNNAGMLAKFYTSNKNIITNNPRPPVFYERAIEMAEEARLKQDDAAWDSLRHEPLSETERNVYRMIDTLRNIPIVKTYTDIFKVLIGGYYSLGKVEVGPYLNFVTWNNIEGWRIQSGLKTTYQFSKKWVLQGQLGYGFKDERIKYLASAQYILSRQRWTTLSFRARSDLGRLGVDDENLADNPIFLAATRWGFFRRGFYTDEYRAAFQRELFKGYSQRVSFRHWTFDPTFDFGYFKPPGGTGDPILSRFQTSEVSIESRYARDEVFLQDDNDRISLGTNQWPVLTVKYTHGFSGVFGSDFDYDKLRANLTKRIKTGPFGVAYVTVTGEYVFNPIPYPLLSLHLGNQSPIYSSFTYNLMNFGEFVSDRYVSVQYRQYLEGFLLNRIPLLNKLKWRLLATSNVVVGGMRQSNRNLIAATTPEGQPTLQAGYFRNSKPYVELGYGVENIFKIFRIDFVHRISYLDNPDARKFGILFSAWLQL